MAKKLPDLDRPVMSLEGPKYPTLERLRGTGSQGSSGLQIKDAPKRAEEFIDPLSNALRDDSVFVPMGDRVLARRIPEAVKTVGGIQLPDSGKTPAAFGVVVGVGQGRYNIGGVLIPVRVDVGAVIMFGKYAGTDIKLFGLGVEEGNCVSLREEEIMGVIMAKDSVPANTDPEVTPVSR